MNKTELLQKYNKQDKILLSNVIDKALMAEKRKVCVTTDFFDMREIVLVISILNKLKIKYEVFDINNMLEKKAIAILPSNCEMKDLFKDIICIKISPKSKENILLHKDYMGAIYNSGISETKIGEIIVNDGEAYVFTFENMFDYLENTIYTVGNTKVDIEKVNINELNISKSYENQNIIVPSLRCDVVLAKLYGFGRNEVSKKISKGDLIINSQEQSKITKEFKEGDVVSFKKCGKFRIVSFEKNKKDKYVVNINLYK